MVSSAVASKVVRQGDTRRCHITSILPLTEAAGENNQRTPIDYRVCLEASAYLAWEHLSSPSNALVSDPSVLQQRLQGCDIEWSMEFFDSQFSGISAARHLQTAIANRPQPPVALLGSARSSVSTTLATLAAAYQLPQISPSSTSDDLDDKTRAPYFGRTVPTNAGDAQALMFYLEQLGVDYVGVYYSQDAFGSSYHSHLAFFANIYNIRLASFAYATTADIPQSLTNMAESGVRYIIGVLNPNAASTVLVEAHRQGLVGGNYSWFLTEASLGFVDSAFSINPIQESSLAEALHGAGILTLDVPTSPSLGNALQELFTDSERREGFYQHHADPSIFTAWEPPTTGCGDSSIYPMFAYDAVLSWGLAMCETPTDLFTGPELYEQLLQTEFEGLSGWVSFQNTTGTRVAEHFSYRMANIRISTERSTNTSIVFDTVPTAQILVSSEQVYNLAQFVYADNSTTPPSVYPPLLVDENLIPVGVRAAGLGLVSLVALQALYLLGWLYCNRDAEMVRASQPIFWAQTLVGTLIILSTVIPWSLQEPASEGVLDVACTSIPWLLSIGFVMAFSALFAKLWRLNQLFGVSDRGNISSGFQRRMVRARDVAAPFIILMFINTGILISWTVVDPPRWQRLSLNNYDSFGRVIETYGTCHVERGNVGGSNIQSDVLFSSLLLGVNVIALGCAMSQVWLARKLPSEFSEVSHIGMSFVLLFEVVLVGIPILLLLEEDPQALFISRAIVLSGASLAMMIPIMAKSRQVDIYRATDPDGRRQRSWYLEAIAAARKRLLGSLNLNRPSLWGKSFMVARDNTHVPNTPSNDPVEPGNDEESNIEEHLSKLSLPSLTKSQDLKNKRSLSVREFGQTRIHRSRDFYEEAEAENIRSQNRSEMMGILREKYSRAVTGGIAKSHRDDSSSSLGCGSSFHSKNRSREKSDSGST